MKEDPEYSAFDLIPQLSCIPGDIKTCMHEVARLEFRLRTILGRLTIITEGAIETERLCDAHTRNLISSLEEEAMEICQLKEELVTEQLNNIILARKTILGSETGIIN